MSIKSTNPRFWFLSGFPRKAGLLGVCLALGVVLGCSQQMRNQPYFRPLQRSNFFADRNSSRPLVLGTVPRGHLKEDTHYFFGRTEEGIEWNQAAGIVAVQDPFAALSLHAAGDSAVDTFPFPITEKVLKRGRERFDIYCSMCHGRTGDGEGMVPARGFTRPPSLHEERLRKARVGYFFRIITEGKGAMADYSAQIKAGDRWAIVAYIRALQLSQYADLSALSPEEKNMLPGGAR